MFSSRAVDHKKIVEIPNRVHSMAPAFPKSEVFRLIGGGDGRIGSKATVRKVQKWTERLMSVAKPRLVHSVETVAEVGTSYLRLDGGTGFPRSQVGKGAGRMRSSCVLCGHVGPWYRGRDRPPHQTRQGVRSFCR